MIYYPSKNWAYNFNAIQNKCPVHVNTFCKQQDIQASTCMSLVVSNWFLEFIEAGVHSQKRDAHMNSVCSNLTVGTIFGPRIESLADLKSPVLENYLESISITDEMKLIKFDTLYEIPDLLDLLQVESNINVFAGRRNWLRRCKIRVDLELMSRDF